MIALILLLFVEIPVRIKIAIDYQRSEFEDRFTPSSPHRAVVSIRSFTR